MTIEQSIFYEGDTKPATKTIRNGESHTEPLGLSPDEIEENDIDALFFLDVTTECDENGEGIIYFKNPFTEEDQPKFVHPGRIQHTYKIINPDGRRGTATWTHYIEKGVTRILTDLYLAPEVKGKSER